MTETEPTRPELAALVGRTVTAEATYTDRAIIRRRDGARLHLVREVFVYPRLTLDHVWISLPVKFARRLRNDERFAFQAQVERYERSNGSTDVGLTLTRILA